MSEALFQFRDISLVGIQEARAKAALARRLLDALPAQPSGPMDAAFCDELRRLLPDLAVEYEVMGAEPRDARLRCTTIEPPVVSATIAIPVHAAAQSAWDHLRDNLRTLHTFNLTLAERIERELAVADRLYVLNAEIDFLVTETAKAVARLRTEAADLVAVPHRPRHHWTQAALRAFPHIVSVR